MLPYFEWMEASGLGAFFRGNVWAMLSAQVVHVCALGVFAGSVVIVDLRLLGRGLTDIPLAELAREAQVWFIGAFLVLFVTGLPQLISYAVREYHSPFFWLKMETMLIALVFTFTVRRRVTLTDEAHLGTHWPRIVAIVSLGLWTGVTIGGRLIGVLT